MTQASPQASPDIPWALIYTKARQIITDPANWCQRYSARDRNGHTINASDPRAVRFDLMGAIQRAVRRSNVPTAVGRPDEYERLYPIIAHCYNNDHTLITVNDELGHQAVLHVLDTAIRAYGPSVPPA